MLDLHLGQEAADGVGNLLGVRSLTAQNDAKANQRCTRRARGRQPRCDLTGISNAARRTRMTRVFLTPAFFNSGRFSRGGHGIDMHGRYIATR